MTATHEDAPQGQKSVPQPSPRGDSPGISNDPVLPLALYGPEFSYFTGKLESVIRFMELPYERRAGGPTGRVLRETGVAQVPALRLADDRWLTDSTPIIACQPT